MFESVSCCICIATLVFTEKLVVVVTGHKFISMLDAFQKLKPNTVMRLKDIRKMI